MRTILLGTLLPLAALAGCLDAGGADLQAAAGALDAAAADDAPTLRSVDVAHDGATPVGACAYTPFAPCTGVARGEQASTWEQKLGGALVGAELTLTWTPLTPATGELLVGIAYRDGDEWKWEVERGASPLTLSRSGLQVPADAEVWVYANAYQCQGGAGFAPCASFEQAFRVEGTLLVAS